MLPLLALLAGPGVALAQVHVGTIAVEGERSADATTPAADDPPFVTVVPAGEASARVVSVADLLEGLAGVRVRSRGGLGAFTSLSVRGSDSGQVAVYLDGVPLNRALGATVDLGQLPVDGLERVEVYRGVPPIELGADAIGGAIHLVSRRGPRRPGTSWRATAGGGSFGARSATLGLSHASGGLDVNLTAAYHGARGDFRYYDNQGTLLDQRDDFFSRRRNAGFDQVALDATLRGTGRLGWSLGSHGFLKIQGVPGLGTAGAETRTARLTTGRLVLEGGLARPAAPDGLELGLNAHLVLERLSFRNLDADRVGGFSPTRTDNETLALGLTGRMATPIGTHQLVSLFGELRVERYQPRDLLSPVPTPRASLRTRAAVALTDEVRLARDRVALQPALRLDAVGSQLADALAAPGQQAPGTSRFDLFVSPRLGLRVRAHDRLWLKGSVGRFVRLPTLLELFGDGAFLVGRPALRPEIAVGGDLGLGLRLGPAQRRPAWGATLELAFFGRSLADTIVLLPAARAFAATNLGPSRVLGLELRAQAEWRRLLGLAVEYTFLDARNFTAEPGVRGRQLPGRARHELSVRLSVGSGRGPVRGFYEAHYLSAVYRDAQNFNQMPARWLHAAGLSVGPARRWPLTLSLEVRNLLDLRVVDLPLGGSANAGRTSPYPLVDFFDYPLPGRAFYATLGWRL